MCIDLLPEKLLPAIKKKEKLYEQTPLPQILQKLTLVSSITAQ